MYIGDLHIHSRYSRATSRDCTPEYLDLWARKKGIDIVGTGDFTHPAWREELEEKLEPAEDGLYVLKKEYRLESAGERRQPRFVITGEISSINKKGDRVRKVHSLLILPGLEAARALAGRLELIGNIHSDGRPILGIPCRDLLEIMLETSPDGIYVPAHIWTPHFSLFGAFSGFDTIEECFEDMAPHIHALETGLSSDPPMNWRVKALDRFCLISNSDAHSPAKMGREACLFDMELSYRGLAAAIQEGKGLAGTIEFFPEEGKYHYDGHRKCGLCISPRKTAEYGNRCPICGKKITIGVLNRVEQLADRQTGSCPPSGRPYESLVPLPEVIGASMGISAGGKKAAEKYERMISVLGPEFAVLREIPIEDIRKEAGPLVAEGIRRLRLGQVERTPGFDGEYGRISLLTPEEISSLEGQMTFFTAEELQNLEKHQKPERGKESENGQKTMPYSNGAEPEYQTTEPVTLKAVPKGPNARQREAALQEGDRRGSLNTRQQEAVEKIGRSVAVIAGPGAGKTRTLIARLQYLLEKRQIPAGKITAVTFTNKAAEEMRSRRAKERQGETNQKDKSVSDVWIGTFHAICSRFLQEAGIAFLVADEGLQLELAEKALREFGSKKTPGKFLQELSHMKNGLPEDGFAGANNLQGSTGSEKAIDRENSPDYDTAGGENRRVYAYYQKLLRQAGALDYDDLLLETLNHMKELPEEAAGRERFSYLLIDEFQDINPLQYRLVKEWGRGGRELFVIGDPDQSIYGFRGCDSKVFAHLERDYPNTSVIKLEENYRSAPAILDAALGLISHNEGGPRRMKALAENGHETVHSVRIVSAADERREAIFVAKEITRQIGGIDMLDTDRRGAGEDRPVRGFSDMAVLYRTHRQAALLEKCFRQEGIPYLVAGREDFLQEREVRATLYFFRHILYPEEEMGAQLCKRFLEPILMDARKEKLAASALEEVREERLLLLIRKYRKKVRRTKPVKLLEEWSWELSFENEEAIKKLTDMSVLYSTMKSFLHTLFFGEDGDIRRSGSRKFTADAVTLMTLHGSKGLEFPVVFLYGMDQGRFPLELNTGETDMEEERRLCYVGMTRAEKELILVCGKNTSPFLQEIPAGYARWERAERTEDEETVQAVQMSLFDLL